MSTAEWTQLPLSDSQEVLELQFASQVVQTRRTRFDYLSMRWKTFDPSYFVSWVLESLGVGKIVDFFESNFLQPKASRVWRWAVNDSETKKLD